MTAKTKSYRIADGLYLVDHVITTDAPKKPAPPTNTNHVFVIDCSGSMYGQLDHVKTHVKNKLATMLKPGDTFSCIWFSGRGQFGTLIEAMRLETPSDMMTIGGALDKWVRPMGLTGFKEPLEEVERLALRVKNKLPSAMHFMSDGMDNQWPRADVLRAIENAGGAISSATIIEYGFYADRAFLSQMAAKVGGAHVFAQDYQAFGSVFERALRNKPTSSKRSSFKVKGDAIGGFVFTVANDEVTAYAIEGEKVTTPDAVEHVFYLSPSKVGTDQGTVIVGDARDQTPASAAVYAAMSLFAMRGRSDVVWPLLKLTGDVRLIDQFASCFGKQKYSDFQHAAEAAALDTKHRRVNGYDPNRVPRDDAFTVLDVLRMLENDPSARLLLDSKEFKYQRIGRAVEANDDALQFEADLAFGGYPLTGLVYNADRPNVSVRVVKKGSVKLPSTRPSTLPESFATQVYRTYTIVKDGIVNVSKLPALVSKDTRDILVKEGAAVATSGSDVNIAGAAVYEVLIDLEKLPVINRKMVNGLTKQQFFADHFTLVTQQAEAKVLGAYLKELAGDDVERTSEDLAKQYGEDAAKWLREQGITSNGFNPKGTTAEASGDFYVAKELNVGLKGLSSLPSLKDAKKKIDEWTALDDKARAKKLLPPAVALMRPMIEEVESMRKKVHDDAKLKAWLDVGQINVRERVRKMQALIAQHTFTIIVGQSWFTDASSLDDNALDLQTNVIGPVTAKAEMKEIEIKL